MTKTDTTVQLATRRGLTWLEWKALSVSRRYEEEALDRGLVITHDMRRGWAIYDLPAGRARLAALLAL